MFMFYKVLCHKLGRKQNEWGEAAGLSGCTKQQTCPRLPISVQAEPELTNTKCLEAKDLQVPSVTFVLCHVPLLTMWTLTSSLSTCHQSWRHMGCGDLHQPRSFPGIPCPLKPVTASILASPSLSF